MIKLLIALMCMAMPLKAFADATEGGGGGHPCKALAMEHLRDINKRFQTDTGLSEKYPVWKKLWDVVNPEINPGFKIKVVRSPIKSCPGTENALACGRPSVNYIQLHCGRKGWDSLSKKEQYKQLIHELYWWQSENDANYYYSSPMADDIFSGNQHHTTMPDNSNCVVSKLSPKENFCIGEVVLFTLGPYGPATISRGKITRLNKDFHNVIEVKNVFNDDIHEVMGDVMLIKTSGCGDKFCVGDTVHVRNSSGGFIVQGQKGNFYFVTNGNKPHEIEENFIRYSEEDLY